MLLRPGKRDIQGSCALLAWRGDVASHLALRALERDGRLQPVLLLACHADGWRTWGPDFSQGLGQSDKDVSISSFGDCA